MKRKTFCGLLLLIAGVVFGQELNVPSSTIALTPDAAIRMALEHNPEIRVLCAGIAAARGEVTTAQTWQNPEVSISPGFKSVRDLSDTMFHGDFGVEQTFEWPGRRALRKAVAEKNVAARQLALAGFRSQLAIQVRRAYSTMLAARELLALREQRLTLARSFVDAAKQRAEGGFAPEFEVTKAEVEVVAAQKALRETQAQQDAARVTLNTLMGRQPTEPLAVTGTLTGELTLPDQTTLLEKAWTQNPAVKVQEAEIERSGLSLQSVRQSRLPDFKIGPSVEYTRDEQTFGLGFRLPLPLWDKKQGEIATATAEQEKARAELEKLRSEILRDVTTARQNLTAAIDSLAFHTPVLRDKLKAALDAAASGYADGRTPLLLYLEAQRTYFDTQADYFATLLKTFEARAELESAVGVPLDQFLQPQPETR